jgi:hypothetical protein
MLLRQDAASLLVAILNKKFRKRIFLGCDNHPLSRLGLLSLQVVKWQFIFAVFLFNLPMLIYHIVLICFSVKESYIVHIFAGKK